MDPARGLLLLLLDPLVDPNILEAKEGTLLRRWRLPIELCSEIARLAYKDYGNIYYIGHQKYVHT